MNKQRLYLFTSEFPYGKQETFLESELKYLSEYFDVIILPRMINDSSIRPINKNVIVNTKLALFGKKKRYTKMFGWTNFSFWVFLFQERKMLSSIQALKRINTFTIEYSQIFNYLKANPVTGNAILYSYRLNGVAMALADYKINFNKHVKSISRAHRYDIYEDLYKPVFWPLRRKVIHSLDKIFIVSKNGLEYVENKYMLSQKLELSRLGVQKIIAKTDIREIKYDIIKFVSISNLHPVKRVPLIAKYLMQFSVDYPNLKIFWDHYGDGIDREKIEIELENKPDNINVKIIDRIPNLKLLESLSHENYDMLINTSLSEGIPVSIMEAISYGIPVLATNVGGVSEIVNEKTGCLIPKDFTYEIFSEKVNFIINNFSKNMNQRLEIISFWKENFSAEYNYTEFANKLMKLIEN